LIHPTLGIYDIYRLINGVSDRDVQLLIINKVQKQEYECDTDSKREINKYTVADFRLKLCRKTWERGLVGTMLIGVLNLF